MNNAQKHICVIYVIILGVHMDTFWKPFYLLCVYSQNIYRGKDVISALSPNKF